MPDTYDPYGRPGTFMQSQHSDSPDASPQPYPRTRQDSAPLLMLPAPLAISNQQSPSVSSSLAESTFTSPGPEMHPNYRLHRTPDDPRAYGSEYRDSDRSEREPILMSPVGTDSMVSPGARGMNVLGHDAVMKNAAGISSYPGETPNPYRHSQHHVAAYEQVPHQGYSAEVVDDNVVQGPPRQRGISLVDHGPVNNPDGPVRRTPRSTKRSSATVTTTSTGGQSRLKHQSMPLSPSSTTSYLPPGAAPPQPQAQGGRY